MLKNNQDAEKKNLRKNGEKIKEKLVKKWWEKLTKN